MKRTGWLGAALVVSAGVHLGVWVLLPGESRVPASEPSGPAVKVEVWAPLPPVLRPAPAGTAYPGPPARAERSRTRAFPRPRASPLAAESELDAPGSAPAADESNGGPADVAAPAAGERGAEQGGVTQGVPGASSVGSGQAGGAAGSPGLLALSERLAEAARACYPPAARRLRLVGSVELLFCAEPDGSASRVALGGTTGSVLLDRAAEGCLLARAAPLPVREGCFRLPVRFGEAVK